MQSLPCRFAATTVSAGAIALFLLSLSSQPAGADPSIESEQVEHLESLLVEHDVRYVLRASVKTSARCLHGDSERGQ